MRHTSDRNVISQIAKRIPTLLSENPECTYSDMSKLLGCSVENVCTAVVRHYRLVDGRYDFTKFMQEITHEI